MLQHIEQIIGFSEENGLDDNFFVQAKTNLEHLSAVLNISPLQAALFSLLVACGENTEIDQDDILKTTKWKIVKMLQNMNEFDELVRKKYSV
jgi:hypothetical protein